MTAPIQTYVQLGNAGVPMFENVFTGQFEPFTTQEAAVTILLASAAQRIAELQAEIVEIKAYMGIAEKMADDDS